MIKVAVVGLGKMGLSHQALLNAHPDVELAAVCDSSTILLGLLRKYTGVATYGRLDKMLDEVDLDAVLIATPPGLHAGMVRASLARGLHVFCEKPFCLDDAEGEELAAEAARRGLVTQVGYHNRFVATFQEVKRLLDRQAIGTVSHILAEAYGPVVLRPQTSTWRSKGSEGGGALYDYAAHPINLVNWYLGEPIGVGGTVLGQVFSRQTDDQVFGTMYFDGGASAQVSVNWSDESVRKMTTRITVWGSQGRIFADRQECQVFLTGGEVPAGYRKGWSTRYTTDLTPPVRFYLRGEEYSAQLDSFVSSIAAGDRNAENDFASAAVTDRSISLLRLDAVKGVMTTASSSPSRQELTERRAADRRPWSGRAAQVARGYADKLRPPLQRMTASVRQRFGK